jgi:uncharacterized protein (DUF2336 family)
MADDISGTQFDEPIQTGRARGRLTRRLADIVCLPESKVAPQERWITADILDDLLKSADPRLRAKVAQRLARQANAPRNLLLRLAADDFEVSEPILRWSQALTDFDMMQLAPKLDPAQQTTLARREQISETVAASLAQLGNVDVIVTLLRNDGAKLSPQTIDFLLRKAVDDELVARRLIERPEMRPRQAFSVFWDVGHNLRRFILERFSASRLILQDAAEDVFPLLAEEDRDDQAVRDALIYIDRRQRNRQLESSSEHGGLEGLIDQAFAHGLTTELRESAANIVSIQSDLFDRVIDDVGGEPLAVLAKAVGLDRSAFEKLLACTQSVDSKKRIQFASVIFNMISVDKAQTVLRYWNWLIARSAY